MLEAVGDAMRAENPRVLHATHGSGGFVPTTTCDTSVSCCLFRFGRGTTLVSSLSRDGIS